MITFTGRDLTNPHEWFKAQKFPLFISEDSQCTMWGRFIYFDQAFLPGVGRNWGTRIASRLGWSKWGRRAASLDTWIYINDAEKRLRHVPLVWFVRTKPTFRS